MGDKLIFLFLLVGTLTLSGCAGCQDCGSIRLNFEVSRFFLDEQIDPDLNYYINGQPTHPWAIIGIHRDYTLEGRNWSPVDMTPEQLANWMNRIRTRGMQAIANYGTFRGFDILSPDGDRVGIWYSVYDWGSIRFPGDNVVRISAPAVRPVPGSFSRNLRI